MGPAIETFSRSIASVRTATLRATAKEAEKTNGRVLIADRAETLTEMCTLARSDAGRSLTSLVEKLLSDYIEAHTAPKRRKEK